MKVLLAHAFYRISGGEDAYVRQQVELLRRDHDVSLLSMRNEDLPGGIATASKMLYSRAAGLNVEGSIRAFRPDVIHLHNPYPAFGPAVFTAAKRLRIPLVVTVHNYRLRCPNGYMFTADAVCTRCERGAYHNAVTNPCFPSRLQGLAYASSLWFHRFALKTDKIPSAFVCPSEFMRATLARLDIPSDKLRLIRNFTQLVPDADPSPGEYGAYVGRLSSEKGVHVLLHALRLAGDPPFKVVGNGPYSDGLRRLASDLSLKNTTFLGRLATDEVDHVVRRARFISLPSVWHENAPLAGLEAMARARPVVASAIGGLPELVGDGRGFATPPGDPAGLAANIKRLMTDERQCRKVGTAALAFARTELSPERHLKSLIDTYREVVG